MPSSPSLIFVSANMKAFIRLSIYRNWSSIRKSIPYRVHNSIKTTITSPSSKSIIHSNRTFATIAFTSKHLQEQQKYSNNIRPCNDQFAFSLCQRRIMSSQSDLFPSNFLDNPDESEDNHDFDDEDNDYDEDMLSERDRKRRRAAMKLEHLDEVREELYKKTGRGWTDPWDLNPVIDAATDFNSLLDWAPEYVSRISQERVQLYSVTDTINDKEIQRTIPTLAELAAIPLPLPPPPNPVQQMKAYALYRKRHIQKYINGRVAVLAEPHMDAIVKLQDWDSKQDAIDVLFEQIEFALQEAEIILSRQPNFETMVERALETYLKQFQKSLKEKAALSSGTEATTTTDETAVPTTTTPDTNTFPILTPEQIKKEQKKKDEMAVPIFIDCYNKDIDQEDVAVPKILTPMKCSVPLKPMVGRMVEEWELSAHKTTKRIMIRQCTRTIAQIIVDATTDKNNSGFYNTTIVSLPSKPTSESISMNIAGPVTPSMPTSESPATDVSEPIAASTPTEILTSENVEDDKGKEVEEVESTAPTITIPSQSRPSPVKMTTPQYNSARILVHGMQGVGKTAAIASIVACARQSGAVVLFIPNGNEMSHLGFYIEPNEKRLGIYDLPILSQNTCRSFMEAHENDVKIFEADAGTLEKYFTEAQLGKLKGYEKGSPMDLATLLNHGIERVEMAAMCYAAAINVLMKQDDKIFLMVLDEGNCFYMPGQYFHETYDITVKEAIPYHKISLFEPIINAMNITSLLPNHDEYSPTIVRKVDDVTEPLMMKRGAVILGLTESHAVSRKVTDALIANAKVVEASSKTEKANADSLLEDAVIVTPPLHTIEVPRLTNIEVQHMLSNYEATGVGNLRLDRGETVMNENEVSYLHMVSGGIPQHLMNACMV